MLWRKQKSHPEKCAPLRHHAHPQYLTRTKLDVIDKQIADIIIDEEPTSFVDSNETVTIRYDTSFQTTDMWRLNAKCANIMQFLI